jgi:hypothetical protein
MADTPPGGLDIEQETCDRYIPTTDVLAPQAGDMNRGNKREFTPLDALAFMTTFYIVLVCAEPLWLLALPLYIFCAYAIISKIADRPSDEQTRQQLQIVQTLEVHRARIREISSELQV